MLEGIFEWRGVEDGAGVARQGPEEGRVFVLCAATHKQAPAASWYREL